MAAFFTPSDLASFVQRDVDTSTATLLGDLASDAVRDDLRQLVDFVPNDIVTVYGDGGEVLVLPERPVTAVTSITIAGQSVPTFDWRPNGMVHRMVFPGSFFAGETWYIWPFGVPVTVMYSHGYVTVPNVIKMVALELAAEAYANPGLVQSETVGGYSVTYSKVSMRAEMILTEEQRNKLDRYRLVDM